MSAALLLCAASVTTANAQSSSIELRAIEFKTTGNIAMHPYLATIERKYVGNLIDADMLQKILREVTDFYRDNGYPSSRAYLPEQSIDNEGRITIDIVYTQIGSVNIDLKKNHLARSTYTMLFRPLKDLSNTNVHTSALQSELLKLSDIGAFHVEASMNEDHDDLSYADINVKVTPVGRISGALIADNYGTKSTGVYRLMGYGTISNITSHADSLSMFLAATDKDYKNYNLNYEIPINSYKTILGTGVCYSHYELANSFDFLDAKGSAFTAEFFLRQPVYRSFNNKTEFTGGYRYRDIKDEFGLFDIEFKKHSHAVYTSVTSSHSFNDRALLNTMGKITYGHLYNDDEYNMGYDNSFLIFNTSLNGRYSFNDYAAAFVSFEAQMASTSLDGSEYFSIGGPEAIAGYKSNKASGDGGFIIKNGISFTPFNEYALSISPNIGYGLSTYKNINEKTTLKTIGADLDFSHRGFFAKLQGAAALGDKSWDDKSTQLWFRFGYSFS